MSQQRSSRTNRTDLRPVKSNAHPERSCEPCILCKRANLSKYFHPKTLNDKSFLTRLQEYEPSLDIKPDSCICRNCRNDVSSIGKSGFVPRWRKESAAESVAESDACEAIQCCVRGCKNSECRIAKVIHESIVCTVFNMPEVENSTDDGIPVCHKHYKRLYRFINPSHMFCRTCGKHISDLTNSRGIPEASMLQSFLLENTEFTGSFAETDKVCLACYKSHLCVIRHIKGSIRSTDEDLTSLLKTLKLELPSLSSDKTLDNAIAYASTVIALYVGEKLLKQSAVLLPVVHEKFKAQLVDYSNEHDIAMVQQDIPDSIWLRSQLSSKLDHHMAYKCSIKKIGTVLYRYGGDLFHALSLSLGEARAKDNISEVCTQLNTKCHVTIKN